LSFQKLYTSVYQDIGKLKFLQVKIGEVDSKRLCIYGGSAGGYTTMAALVFKDTFTAGASLYGVSSWNF